ncbi:MAG: adenosylcobinamide-GDP ribazoletransferase [Chloroflexi bacterium]|nr:adenosylcobinamide-GDP ribazoletransferase [Chloroflexota bacterium]
MSPDLQPPTSNLQPPAPGPQPLASLLLAVQFLTVLPVPGRASYDAKALGGALAYFPLVGALLGASVAGADVLLRSAFAPPVADAAVLALLAGLTGALHLDGVADACDGLLAPGRDRAERLAIMHDSRVGSFGVVGLVLLLLLKLAALGALPAAGRAAALLAAPALGRWIIVYAYAAHPYARPEPSASAALKQGASPLTLAVATAWTVLASLALGPAGLLALVAAGVLAITLVRLMAARLGGVTGDTCGAACEVAETLALLLAPLGVRS